MATHARVTRLRTRTKPYEEIVDSYFDGLFDVCVGALQAHATPSGAALCARAQLRLGCPADALETVTAVIAATPVFTHAELGELMMHRAVALVRLGRGDEPDTRAALATARAHVFSAMNPALEAELAFAEAYTLVLAGDLRGATSAAGAVFDIAPDASRPQHVVPVAHSLARAHDLLAFMAARREDDDRQTAHLRDALAVCSTEQRRDVVFEANVLANLAIRAREHGDTGGAVRAGLEALGEAEHLNSQRYEILRSLAWSNALAGNHIGTFRDLRDASEAAPTTPTKIRAIVDRAFFARELGQGIIAREEIDYALRLSERVDWNDAASDERELDALLGLSVALVGVDVGRARATIDRYRRLKPKLGADTVAATDRRARAEEIGAEAKILRAEGDLARARSLFLDAFATWDERGYGMRAAVVARELAALDAGDAFAAYVDREVASRPNSWFAVSVRRGTEADTLLV